MAWRAPASRPATSIPTSAAGRRPDRREHAEAAAHVGRHFQRRDALAGGELAERAARRVGGEDEVPGRRAAERVLEPLADHQVLRHRLRRAARLADHVHQHPPGIDPPERGIDRGGIHVLQHGEPGEEVAPLVVQLVPRRPAERVQQGLGAQRRPADAEHQDVVVRLAQALGEGRDLAHRLALVHQPVEAVLARPAAAAHFGLHLANRAASSASRARGSPCRPSRRS